MRLLLLLFVVLESRIFGAGTTVRFDLSSPESIPFPSDLFTVAESEQKTGRRINLPLPDCMLQPSSCNELNLINQLDGFSLTARIRVRFSGEIDTATAAVGIAIIALDNLTQEEDGVHKPGDRIRINQIVYDPGSHTVYAKPDSVLDQHRRYALVVTDEVRDTAGDPIAADPAFTVCAQGNGGEYCTALGAAMREIEAAVGPGRIAGASVFTTMSATAWLEKARSALEGTPTRITLAEPLGRFRLADIASLVVNQQTGVNPVKLTSFEIPLGLIPLQGLGGVAIASFRSPNFLDAGQTIAAAPTGSELKPPAGTNEVFFNVLLPEAPPPQPGYPVVIFGHGFGDSRFGGPTAVSPSLTSAGFAVIGINAVGHGFGPESTVSIKDKQGNTVTLRSGGRSVDLNGDGQIASNEGCAVSGPVAIGTRDCFRQTVVDLLQLVRVIRAGIDLDGDGFPDLDGSRIYYAGQSLGAIYGTILNALEPNVRAAVLNVGGGSITEIARTSPSYRDLATSSLRDRTPPLLNKGDSWDEDYVLRDKPVKRVSVEGALAIQEYFELVEWLGTSGDPLAYAPHLKLSPLPGSMPKPVLFQFALGDRTVPNPASSALIRAAGMRENAWLYRHDRARRVDPTLPANPHPYLVLFADVEGDGIKLPGLVGLGISSFVQGQVAAFFGADGGAIPDPNNALIQLLVGAPLFEVPEKLPENPGF